jgi:hypothetical protein
LQVSPPATIAVTNITLNKPALTLITGATPR